MKGSLFYEKGLTKIGNAYKLGVVVPKNKSDYNSAFDCAEFASWIVFQVAGILYGTDLHDVAKAAKADAYTGYWANDAKKLGTIISVEKAIKTKGAFLLRIAGDGLIGHIVCSDGLGGTVEAHSTKKGVGKFSTKGRRFDVGVLIPSIEYQEGNVVLTDQKPKGIVYRFTTPMMPKSDVVKMIQVALVARGFYINIDGWFDKGTMNAVYDFQKKNGLTPDGEVYTETAKALNITL